MFQSGDQWKFSICPKTFNQEAYCPICAVTNKLYKGNEADKSEAQKFKRKEKFVSNIYVVSDPRDIDKDDDKKSAGKVKLYEFPSKVEALIRSNITDTENGVGMGAYDPEAGFNFVLKVGLTKKDGAGKEWPSYDSSTFARQSSAVADTEKEIEELINSTVDIVEHLRKQLPNEEKIIEELKNCLVFELIEEDYDRKKKIDSGVSKPKEKKVEESSDELKEEKNDKQDEKIENSSSSSVDEDLLAELKSLGV